MKIVTQIKHGVLVARIEGELDVHSAEQLRAVLDEALDESRVNKMLLNLNGVSFIDSSGLGVILGRYKRISHSGGKLLFSNVKPQVDKILEVSGLLKVIPKFDSELKALESL